MTDFTVRLIVLSLPGIVCMFLLHRLIGRREQPVTEMVLLIFVYSILSYLIYCLFCILWNHVSDSTLSCQIGQMLSSESYRPTTSELTGGVLSAFVLSLLLSYLNRYNALNFIAQIIRATNRYGDEDVWHFFHNAPEKQKNNGWVFVRDHKLDLVYYGYINAWSESGKQRELVLSDVSVFHNKSGDELYSIDVAYLSRNADDLTIEVPRQERIEVIHERPKEVDGRP